MLLLTQAPGGALSARCTSASTATTVTVSASTVNGRWGSVRLKKDLFSKSQNRRNSQFLTLVNGASDGDSLPVSTSTSNAPKPLPRPFGGADGDETVFVGEEGVPLEGVIRLEKDTGSSSSSSISLAKKWGKVVLLASGDAMSLLAFSAIGRFSHGFPIFDLDTVQTADPFVAGWFLSAYFLGAYSENGRGENGRKNAIVAAAKSWALGIPLGVAIRAFSIGHIPPTSFILVTMGSTAVLLIGWRALLHTILPSGQAKRNDAYKQGNPFELFELLSSLIRRW